MKAIVKDKYGGPEVLRMEEVRKPQINTKELLIKVKANSANPADWHLMRGKPYFARIAFGLFKPKTKILGADFAGIVEEVGSDVTNFKVGDSVFGESLRGGAFAEYLAVEENNCGLVPDNVSFTEMASVPVAGLTAWQALVDHGKLQKGESVLINGSTGGVGHFTVQIAKALGASKVVAVCSSSKASFVMSLGADEVIAYDKENIHSHNQQYDLVIDTHGNLFHADYKRMGRRGVMVGFTSFGHMMRLMLKRAFSKFQLAQFTAEANTKDLNSLAELIATGQVKVEIEKTYSSEEIPQAIAYIEQMHTRGKVAMSWE